MGILNAIFAPFIVLYVLMYSFFRYFEVGEIFKMAEIKFNTSVLGSNIIRTHRPSAVDDTPPSLVGNFGSLTSCHTYLLGGWMKAILYRTCTLGNFPMRK